MTGLGAALDRIAGDLRSLGARWAVVGGLARIEPEIVAAAERLEILPGVSAAVIQRGHLLALKVLAGRLQDQADAVKLLVEATDQDRNLAVQALELIAARGFGRGKDLGSELERMLRSE